MTSFNAVYCDVVAGELIYFFHEENIIAKKLLEKIRQDYDWFHTKICSNMVDKLKHLGLQKANDFPYQLYLLKVPEGCEVMKINYLLSEYQIMVTQFVAEVFDKKIEKVKELAQQYVDRGPASTLLIIPNGYHSLNSEKVESEIQNFSFTETHQDYKKKMGFDKMKPIEDFCKVLIIDSGIEEGHHLNVVQQVDFLSAYEQEIEENKKGIPLKNLSIEAIDRNGHGTAIANMIVDICPNIPLVIYKIVNESGCATEWDLVAALIAQNDADVVNISLSYGLPKINCKNCGRLSTSTRSYVMEYVLYELYTNGNKSIVISAGNDNQDKASFPARFDYTLAVVSLNQSFSKSSFSNYGDENFWGDKHPNLFAAFGGEKDSEPIFYSPFGINGWGTSLSAAYMTSLVAYLWSYSDKNRSWLKSENLKSLIEASIKTHFTYKKFPSYKQDFFGHGLIKIEDGVIDRLVKELLQKRQENDETFLDEYLLELEAKIATDKMDSNRKE